METFTKKVLESLGDFSYVIYDYKFDVVKDDISGIGVKQFKAILNVFLGRRNIEDTFEIQGIRDNKDTHGIMRATVIINGNTWENYYMGPSGKDGLEKIKQVIKSADARFREQFK